MNDMERYFIDRTKKHISRVGEFLSKSSTFFPQYKSEFESRALSHDQSKFLIPERKWYILLNWNFKLRLEGKEVNITDKQKDHIRDVTFHHCKTNQHHPEYWDQKLKVNPINRDNREKRDVVVDASLMSEPSIIEMVCDWSAMSVEHGDDSPRKWADESVAERWKFTTKQIKLIYSTIDLLWR